MRKVDDKENFVIRHDFLMSFQVLRIRRSCLNTEFSLSSTILTCSYTFSLCVLNDLLSQIFMQYYAVYIYI